MKLNALFHVQFIHYIYFVMKKPKGLSDKSLVEKYGKTSNALFESVMKKAVMGNTSQSKPVTKPTKKK